MAVQEAMKFDHDVSSPLDETFAECCSYSCLVQCFLEPFASGQIDEVELR